MKLSNSLIKQFTEATRDKPDASAKNEAYGTVTSDGKVILDGSSIPTPCQSTVSLNEGDRVLVKIENHQAVIIGNITSPSMDEKAVTEITDEIAEDAEAAMRSANGKNKVFHQSTAPSSDDGLTAGDIWFDTANDNQINTWTGSAWSAFELGEDAIANLAITNAKIANATIQYGKIASLDMGTATTGKLKAQYIDVDNLFAQNITVTNTFQIENENYSLLVNDQWMGMTFYAFDEQAHTGCQLTMKQSGIADLYGSSEAHLNSSGTVSILGGSSATINNGTSMPVDVYGRSTFHGNVSVTSGYNGATDAWEPGNLSVSGSATAGSLSVSGSISEGGTALSNKYSKLLSVESKTITFNGGSDWTSTTTPNITANSRTGGSNDTAYCSVSKNGYTPIGVVGTNLSEKGASYLDVYRSYLYSNLYYYGIRNRGSSDFKGKLTVYVLYVKN